MSAVLNETIEVNDIVDLERYPIEDLDTPGRVYDKQFKLDVFGRAN